MQSHAIGLDEELAKLNEDDALGQAVRSALAHFGVERPPAFKLRIESDIPVAAGLGSGAAVSAAVVRAVAAFLGQSLSDEEVSTLTFETEKIHHGTPSGLDNTVVAYSQAVYFEKGQAPQRFEIGRPLDLLIADTGVASKTRAAVEDLRAAWKKEPEKYERIFKGIGEISRQARRALRLGQRDKLGGLMDENQGLLQAIGISSQELDDLIDAAKAAGAGGAKLSGGGRGGHMLALVEEDKQEQIEQALIQAGAANIIRTRVQ